MKKTLIFLAFLFVTLIFATIFWWTRSMAPVSEDVSEKRLLITKGQSAQQIANKLHEEGFIKSPLAFKLYVQIYGKQNELFAGEFYLSESLSVPEIVEKLGEGPSLLWVTIPEGFRREQVSKKVADDLAIDNTQFVLDFLALTKGQEGYLFPDTYLFPKDVTAENVVSVLRNTHNKKLSQIENSSGYPIEEVIIVASLIEREAKTDAERPIIAGILWKRLENDWPLQVDASVQYQKANALCAEDPLVCENWWPQITREDIESPSTYNTYSQTGLPSAPISNPGIASIEAAANPKSSEYWFYIHDAEGVIHYASTIEEHNSNVREYLGK